MSNMLARNALSNVLQILLSTMLLFLLYRYLSATLGIAKLGVWSVVLATASASRIADFGLSVGVTRFVAKYLSSAEPRRAAAAIETAALTLWVTFAIVLVAVYPLLSRIIAHVFESEHQLDALSLLPYAMLSLWFSIVVDVFQSGLDGCQRMDLRAGLVLAGQMLLFALALLLVPQFGLIGLAWAQIGQGVSLLIIGWWLLRRRLPQLSRVPWHWQRDILREMLGYGVNVQIASFAMIIFDPLTKALMARFGGATAAGYFEIATQVVIKVRSIIVGANKAIVPMVVQYNENLPQRIQKIYQENMQLLVLITLPVYTFLFVWSSFVSQFLLGEYNTEFVFYCQLAVAAWALNTFSGPAYFFNLGTGRVGWNTLSHLTIGGLNVILGFLLGRRFGADGVALAYAGSLTVGSCLLIYLFQKINAVPIRVLALREHLGLVSATLFSIVYASLDVMVPYSGKIIHMSLILLVPLLIIGVATWLHPMRKRLWTRLLDPAVAKAAK